MLNSVQSALVNPLEPSSWAAALLGPNALMPAAARSSTIPATSGVSGPTTTKSTLLVLQKSITAGWSVMSSGDAFGLVGDAGIARRAPQFGQQRRSGDLPRQSVFAAAGTEQEDVHEYRPDEGIRGQSVARISRRPQGDINSQPPSFRTARTRRSGISMIDDSAVMDSGFDAAHRPGMTEVWCYRPEAAMISCSIATWRAKAPRPAAVAVTVVCGFLPTKAFSTAT